jgi:hypothetical protein
VPSGKHSPCLLDQYINRVGTRFYNLFCNGEIEAEDFAYTSLIEDRLISGEGAIWTRGDLARIDATERLVIIDRTEAGPWVKRKHYSYHATLTIIEGGQEGNNIRRNDSPHERLHGPDYHSEHHVHCYWPFSEKEEKVLTLKEEETPTLGEFVEAVLDWQSRHYEGLKHLVAGTPKA